MTKLEYKTVYRELIPLYMNYTKILIRIFSVNGVVGDNFLFLYYLNFLFRSDITCKMTEKLPICKKVTNTLNNYKVRPVGNLLNVDSGYL